MITVAVQAGGRSSRMGQDKALIKLGGMPLIEHVLQRVEGLGDEVLITTNRPHDYAFLGRRMVSDRKPGAGALHGLLTALEAAQGERVLLVGCDMPFVSRDLLQHMLLIDADAEVVIPRFDDRYQPLQAVYAKSCVEPVAGALQSGEQRMISFFPGLRISTVEADVVNRIDPSGMTFFNVNTPEDLATAEHHFASMKEAGPPKRGDNSP